MTEDQLKRYLKYLQSHGYTAEIENGNIKVSVTIENINVILKCALSRFFPYEIPQIFIVRSRKKHYLKCHISIQMEVFVFSMREK